MGHSDSNGFGGFGASESSGRTGGVNGSSGDGSDVSRTQYKDQIHVKGEFGTRTVRRDDEPDYGVGRVHAVVTFTGTVDYNGDAVVGCVSLSEQALNSFVDDIDGRVDEYEINTFEVGD